MFNYDHTFQVWISLLHLIIGAIIIAKIFFVVVVHFRRGLIPDSLSRKVHNNNIHQHSGVGSYLHSRLFSEVGLFCFMGGGTAEKPTDSDAKGEAIIFASWKKKKRRNYAPELGVYWMQERAVKQIFGEKKTDNRMDLYGKVRFAIFNI